MTREKAAQTTARWLPIVVSLVALGLAFGACPKVDSLMPRNEAQAQTTAISQRLSAAEAGLEKTRDTTRADILRLENKIDEVLRYLRDQAGKRR